MIKLIVLSSILLFTSCASTPPEITSKLIELGSEALLKAISKNAEKKKKKKEKVAIKKTSQKDRGKSPAKKND